LSYQRWKTRLLDASELADEIYKMTYAGVLLPFTKPLFERGYNLVVSDMQGYGYNSGLKGDFEWNAHKQNLKDVIRYTNSRFHGKVWSKHGRTFCLRFQVRVMILTLILQGKPCISHENYAKPVLVFQPGCDIMTPKYYSEKVFKSWEVLTKNMSRLKMHRISPLKKGTMRSGPSRLIRL